MRGNMKIAFSLRWCISALPEFQQLLDFFNLFDSRLIFTLLCDSLNLVINAFNLGLLGMHGSGKKKSRALQKLDCVACTMHQCSVFWASFFAKKCRNTKGAVGKQSIFWFLTFLVTLLPKVIVIGSCMSMVGRFFETQCITRLYI